MSRTPTLLLLLGLTGAPLSAAPVAPGEPAVRRDALGDPLPRKARARFRGAGRLGTVRLRQVDVVRFVRFSPDGKILASGGTGGPVYFWDVRTGRAVRRLFDNLRGGVGDFAFSPDAKRLVGACGYFRVVELATGKETAMAGVDGVGASVVAVSPDGKTLATGYGEGIAFWDFRQLIQQRKFDSDGLAVEALAFSPDGKIIAAGGRPFGKGALIQLWDVRTGKRIHSLNGHRSPVESLAFTPDGKTLITGGTDSVRCWDPATGKEIRRLDKARGPVALSRDGKLLATATDDGGIKLWDAVTGKQIRAVGPARGRTQSLALSPDGKLLASTDLSKSIALWDVATGRPALSFPGHAEAVAAVGFAPDGKTLASRAIDGKLVVWDVATSSERHRFALGTGPADGWGRPLAFSPDGKSLAAPSPERQAILLWDPDTGAEQRAISAPDPQAGSNYPSSGVAFSPDGGTVGGLSFLGGIRLWSADTGNVLRSFEPAAPPGPPGRVPPLRTLAMAFSPDKRTLAASTSDGRIHFWDWTTGKERGRIAMPQIQAGVLAYSPDGKVLASCTGSWPWAGTEHEVRLWDVKTGQLLRVLRGHQGTVRDLAFVPGGRLLASAGGEDKTVRVWDVGTGKELLKLEGHTGAVLCVAYSADGKTVASGSADTTVLLWDVRGVHAPERADAPKHR